MKRKKLKKFQKTLDKSYKVCYNIYVLERKRQADQEKNFQKTLKKVLTNRQIYGIIYIQ